MNNKLDNFRNNYMRNNQFTKQELDEHAVSIKDANGNILVEASYETTINSNGIEVTTVVVNEFYKGNSTSNKVRLNYISNLERFLKNEYLHELQQISPSYKNMPKYKNTETYKSLSVGTRAQGNLVEADYFRRDKLEGNVYINAPRLSIKDSLNKFEVTTPVLSEEKISNYMNNEVMPIFNKKIPGKHFFINSNCFGGNEFDTINLAKVDGKAIDFNNASKLPGSTVFEARNFTGREATIWSIDKNSENEVFSQLERLDSTFIAKNCTEEKDATKNAYMNSTLKSLTLNDAKDFEKQIAAKNIRDKQREESRAKEERFNIDRQILISNTIDKTINSMNDINDLSDLAKSAAFTIINFDKSHNKQLSNKEYNEFYRSLKSELREKYYEKAKEEQRKKNVQKRARLSVQKNIQRDKENGINRPSSYYQEQLKDYVALETEKADFEYAIENNHCVFYNDGVPEYVRMEEAINAKYNIQVENDIINDFQTNEHYYEDNEKPHKPSFFNNFKNNYKEKMQHLGKKMKESLANIKDKAKSCLQPSSKCIYKTNGMSLNCRLDEINEIQNTLNPKAKSMERSVERNYDYNIGL